MRQRASSYFADLIFCPLLASGLSVFALARLTLGGVIEWFLMVAAGAALWTLIEYVMHRTVYHRIPLFERYHEVHHADPRAYVGAPPMLGTSIVFLVSFLPLAAFSPVLASAISVGMLAGYSVYMIVHHACHFWAPASRGYLRRVRLHHAVHHFRDGNGNFGVSTSFWDDVFGTRIQPSPVRRVIAPTS
jgi:sterol desaturase/sphingolipid hydroxylase (fatty acid hydroxylase superfamily)